MGKRDKNDNNEDLNQPWDKLNEEQKRRERVEWHDGAPARDDDGNPVK